MQRPWDPDKLSVFMQQTQGVCRWDGESEGSDAGPEVERWEGTWLILQGLGGRGWGGRSPVFLFRDGAAGGSIGGAELTSALEASLSVVDCRKAGTGWRNCPETSQVSLYRSRGHGRYC